MNPVSIAWVAAALALLVFLAGMDAGESMASCMRNSNLSADNCFASLNK